MRSSLLLLASLASLALANPAAMLLPRELAVFLPLDARQGNVSPAQYACHDACGNAILEATGDYCSNTKWNERLDTCLDCANDFGIWKWYGDKVTAAAKACGKDVVPTPADASASAGSSSSVAPSTAAVSSFSSTAVAAATSIASAAVTSSIGSLTTAPVVATPSPSVSGSQITTVHINSTASVATPSATSSVPTAAGNALNVDSSVLLAIAALVGIL